MGKLKKQTLNKYLMKNYTLVIFQLLTNRLIDIQIDDISFILPNDFYNQYKKYVQAKTLETKIYVDCGLLVPSAQELAVCEYQDANKSSGLNF